MRPAFMLAPVHASLSHGLLTLPLHLATGTRPRPIQPPPQLTPLQQWQTGREVSYVIASEGLVNGGELMVNEGNGKWQMAG